jgi:hypothetical protein
VCTAKEGIDKKIKNDYAIFLGLVYCDMITWSVASQRLDEYASAATDNISVVEELWEAVFSMLSVSRLYREGARAA